MTSSVAKADCGEVTITEMNWASGAVVTSIAKFLMEQGYGCEIKTVPSSTIPAVTSVAETGKPDIVTELWYNSAPMYQTLVDEGKVTTASQVLSDGGIEAWWIPTYLAKSNPELTTIDGILANPAAVGGMFHNCPEGWGCRVVNDQLKIVYDFAGNGIEVFDHGSSETLATAVAAAYAEKAPWFGYFWAPTAVLGKYDMTKVDVGPYNEDAFNCLKAGDCKNPQKTDYPAAPVVTAVTTDFAERQPEIFKLMQHVSFTNAQMGAVLAWQEDNNGSPDEAAVYFLTNYKDVWSSWISADAKMKLTALLK
jgi:glycine betaine/proline transport system substrate-binding protein